MICIDVTRLIKKVLTKTIKAMKSLNQETKFDLFNEFVLSIEEMINVRGGDGDANDKGTTVPPVTVPEI